MEKSLCILASWLFLGVFLLGAESTTESFSFLSNYTTPAPVKSTEAVTVEERSRDGVTPTSGTDVLSSTVKEKQLGGSAVNGDNNRINEKEEENREEPQIKDKQAELGKAGKIKKNTLKTSFWEFQLNSQPFIDAFRDFVNQIIQLVQRLFILCCK